MAAFSTATARVSAAVVACIVAIGFTCSSAFGQSATTTTSPGGAGNAIFCAAYPTFRSALSSGNAQAVSRSLTSLRDAAPSALQGVIGDLADALNSGNGTSANSGRSGTASIDHTLANAVANRCDFPTVEVTVKRSGRSGKQASCKGVPGHINVGSAGVAVFDVQGSEHDSGTLVLRRVKKSSTTEKQLRNSTPDQLSARTSFVSAVLATPGATARTAPVLDANARYVAVCSQPLGATPSEPHVVTVG